MFHFVPEFESKFNRLDAMGYEIEDEMKVAHLFASFGDKSKSRFGAVINALQPMAENVSWETAST